jgi:hypothetical protein
VYYYYYFIFLLDAAATETFLSDVYLDERFGSGTRYILAATSSANKDNNYIITLCC